MTDTELPKLDFTMFVVTLGTSAMMQLGEIPDETGAASQPNPELAKQTIDILEMLEVKTEGNLSPDEAQILKSNLHELRMRYVKLTNG